MDERDDKKNMKKTVMLQMKALKPALNASPE
jgi:hypothetical protein